MLCKFTYRMFLYVLSRGRAAGPLTPERLGCLRFYWALRWLACCLVKYRYKSIGVFKVFVCEISLFEFVGQHLQFPARRMPLNVRRRGPDSRLCMLGYKYSCVNVPVSITIQFGQCFNLKYMGESTVHVIFCVLRTFLATRNWFGKPGMALERLEKLV